MPGFGNFATFVGGPLTSAGGLGTRIGTAFVSLTTDNTGLTRGFAQAMAQAEGFGARLSVLGRGLSTIGGNLTRYLSVPLVAAGGVAVKMASDFQTAMTRTSALAGVASRDLEAFTSRVLQLSHATAQAPTDLANALYFVASAGLKDAQVLPVLKASAEAAATGMGTAADIGNLLTGVLVGYSHENVTAAQTMDILTAAIREGKAEPADLANNLGTVIEVAAQMGVSFDQVAGVIAALTNVNVNAARGATGLRYMLISLMNPSEIAKKSLASFGLTIQQLQDMIAKEGLLPTLKMMADTFDLTTAAGKEAFFTILGGVRAGHIALSLVGQDFKGVQHVLDETAAAAGDANDEFKTAFDTMRETPGFKFAQAFNDLKIAAIDAGGFLLPIAQDIVEAVGNLGEAFASLPPAAQQSIVKIGLFAAAIGPVTFLVGKFVSVLGGVFSAMGAFRLGMTSMTGMFIDAGGNLQNATGFAAMPSLLTRIRAGLAALPAAAKFAIWAAGIVGLVVAYHKLQDVQQTTAEFAKDFTSGLEKGKFSADDLRTAMQNANEEGSFFGDALINIAGALNIVDTPMDTVNKSIDAFREKVILLTDEILSSDAHVSGWLTTLQSTGPGSVSQRVAIAKLVDTYKDLGIQLSTVQQREIQGLVASGNYLLAKKLLGEFVGGKLKGSMDQWISGLHGAARAEAEAAIKAGNYLHFLRLIRQEHERSAEAVDAYKTALAEAQAAGFTQLQEADIKLPFKPGGYPGAPQIMRQPFRAVVESTELSPEQGVRILNAMVAARLQGIDLKDFADQAERVAKTGKGVSELAKALEGAALAARHTRLIATTFADITQSIFDSQEAYNDWAALLTAPVVAGDVKLPDASKIEVLLNRLYNLGGEINPMSRKGTELRFFINQGKVHAAMNLILGEIDRVSQHPAQIKVDDVEARTKIRSFADYARSVLGGAFGLYVNVPNPPPVPIPRGGGHGGGPGSTSPQQEHSGGLIGPSRMERFHSGGLKPDEVPAVLQRGEYVIRRSSVQKIGVHALERINRMHEGGVAPSPRGTPEPGGTVREPPVKIYVQGRLHPELQAVAEQAVAMWNKAIGAVVLKMVPDGTKGAVPIRLANDRNDWYKFGHSNRPADEAEYTQGQVRGTRSTLLDVADLTLAHELGHALGLSHPALGSTYKNYIYQDPNDPSTWTSRVAKFGLMGNQMHPGAKGFRGRGPSPGEIAYLREEMGYRPAGHEARTPEAPAKVTEFVAKAIGTSHQQRHSGGPVAGFARMHEGSMAHGDVPAILQRGEYVVSRSAVSRVGVPALDAINRLHEGGPIMSWMRAQGAGAGTRMPSHSIGSGRNNTAAEIEAAMERVMARHGSREVAGAIHELASAMSGGRTGDVYMDGYKVGRTLERSGQRRREM